MVGVLSFAAVVTDILLGATGAVVSAGIATVILLLYVLSYPKVSTAATPI